MRRDRSLVIGVIGVTAAAVAHSSAQSSVPRMLPREREKFPKPPKVLGPKPKRR